MKQIFPLFLFLILQADEFPLVKPISVEKAPSLTIHTIKNVPQIKKNLPPKKPISQDKVQKEITNTTLLKIDFQINSAKIHQNSTQILEDFSDYLLSNKAYQVVIYAYTDNSGYQSNNLILSQQRAKNVINALEKLGVSSTRLTAIGMGEKNPIADNNTLEGRYKNRRIEALIIE